MMETNFKGLYCTYL